MKVWMPKVYNILTIILYFNSFEISCDLEIMRENLENLELCQNFLVATLYYKVSFYLPLVYANLDVKNSICYLGYGIYKQQR